MDNHKEPSVQELLDRWRSTVEGTTLPQPPLYKGADVAVKNIVEHTDYVNSGSCFVARVRTESDGHPYIATAIEKGASLIIGQRDITDINIDFQEVPYLRVADSALTEAWLAAAFHQFPSQHLVTIGVTGTDGKTTTTNLIFQMLRMAGIKAGMLSTIKASYGEEEEPLALHVTTPEAPVIQEHLRKMVEAGLTHCVLEVTSHSLAQHRVEAIDFDLAVVTNITHEHLDYHGDFEGYLGAKARLLQALDQPKWNLEGSLRKGKLQKTAVLNLDDTSHDLLESMFDAKRITYGIQRAGQVLAKKIAYSNLHTSFDLILPGQPAEHVESQLVGEFNLYNILAASSAAYLLGLSPEQISSGIRSMKQISGRMEIIDAGQAFMVIVDFAHTPNALAKAIGAARAMTDGRVITVFGSAGKRDVEKRRLMAQISARQADLTVLTAEDPRTESLDSILEMMADGCLGEGRIENRDFWRVSDRGQAIYLALTLARTGDLVLICGKGHEQSMCFQTVEYPWDDRMAAYTALEAFLSGKPMVDLGLPTFDDGSQGIAVLT